MYLQKILDYKKEEIKAFKKTHSYNEFEGEIVLQNKNVFKDSIKIPGSSAIIAEIKKASPSMGVISKDFDFLKIAQVYEESGANAISVLTDKKFFQGDIKYLKKISEEVQIPLLRKDFILDEIQILEAKANGADAVLLIKAALSTKRLEELIEFTRAIYLDALVEVHDQDEVKESLEAGADIIGVNNRNLVTFEMNLENSAQIMPLIPADCVRVSESGIKTKEDIRYLKKFGVDAFLIGTSFMQSSNKKKLFDQFLT